MGTVKHHLHSIGVQFLFGRSLMAVFMKNVVLITKRWETTNQSYNFCMFAQHNSISLRQSRKENKSTTTHRRWSLTRVFYAMYLERTIIDFTGGHGVYTLPRQKRLNASTACSMRCLFFYLYSHTMRLGVTKILLF